MDPLDPASFNHRFHQLSTGRAYHFVDQLPAGYDPKRTATILCVHGFPDLWYGWRYQIGPWVRQGYRVVVPDMLGYGNSDKPVDPSEYSTKKLCADLAALLDLLDVKRTILVGHDWGAYTAGRFALWFPERLLALVILSVPYTPPSKEYKPLEEVIRFAPNFGYQLYFENPKSSLEILARLKKFILVTFRPPHTALDFTSRGSLEKFLVNLPEDLENKSVLTDQEVEYYRSQLQKGMFGPLNYYRTTKFRHEEELGLSPDVRPDLPVLFMWGTKDPTTTKFVIHKSRKFIPQLQDIALEDKGHWVMVEAKNEITETVLSWLKGLTSAPVVGKL